MSFSKSWPADQACAVPYRRNDGHLEFCLITTRQGNHWGFPKGSIEFGHNGVQTALKESHEEAGLHGVIEGQPLGRFQYNKGYGLLSVTVFLMQVTRADDAWEEDQLRKRCWCSADEARQRIDREPVRQLLETALARLAAEQPSS
ncbi:MAG: NUDIX hydrolase [Pirellulales bacterium]